MEGIKSSYDSHNYNFKDDNSVIDSTIIKYAENILNRNDTISKISDITKNIKIAIDIEFGIFEFSLLYCINNFFDVSLIMPIYEDKKINILLNLNKNSVLKNNYLLDEILKGNINPKTVAFLKPIELFPNKWNSFKIKMEYKKWKEDNIDFTKNYKCNFCGESKSRINLIQTRSADEPPTTFITCLVCKTTTKFD
jgi:DNA-directed RNA polymerase subunit M/transcription elongation factor TFIIS